VTWNAPFKTRFSPPPGYQALQDEGREIWIRKGHEADLRNRGLLNPSELWEETPDLGGQPTGRGEVLIIKGHRGEVAVRKYRHGGLLRRLTGDLFFFNYRPFQELVVTEEVKSAGVPTLDILAAIIERRWGGWYRGYLITTYLATATDLISYLDQEPQGERRRRVIEKTGEAVKRMHQAGIYHADLHLKNFLVGNRGQKVYLIDFDKSASFAHLSPSRRIKNLMRVDRSAEKLKRLGLSLTERDERHFCRAYAAGDKEIRPYLKVYHERYRWYQLLYRWGWWIARVFYPRHRPWRKSAT
jgi:tRNA A-37 threonylcarbamoyl transferase component Bud32